MGLIRKDKKESIRTIRRGALLKKIIDIIIIGPNTGNMQQEIVKLSRNEENYDVSHVNK